MDKIYVSTPTKIAILDHEKKRTFVIRKDGLPDAGEIYPFLVSLLDWIASIKENACPLGNVIMLPE